MELTIHIDDSDISPGRYLTGTITLHLTAHYPQPAPPSASHPTPYDDDPSSLYQHHLARHYLHLLHTAGSSPPRLQVTELLDRLQLQVLGKCLPDVSKIPKDVLHAVRPLAADSQSLTVLNTATVTLDRFDRPLPFDLLHQPYTYAWSVLLPASLPPSYRGHSHRIVYYVSAAAYRGEQLLLNIKLPFRVRVTPPYYEGYSEEKVIVQLPLTLTITSTIEHRRLHPPLLQEVTNQSEAAAAVDAAVVGTASHVASVAEREHVGSVQNDALVSFTGGDSDSLLSPPARQVFPTATLQRSYSANSSTPQLVLLPSALSAESHAASSFLTDFSPATPPTPPTPDYRSIRAKIHDLRLSQLKNEPTTFPSCLPSSQLLSTFLSAIRTPLSFNISEQSQPTSTSPIASLPVTHIRVERSAFRPGDTVRLSFDFSAAALPTYRAWLTLDWLEETVGGLRHVQSVASAHVYCLSAVEVPVELQLPRDATCNWASSLMRGGWRLSFHFVIGRPRSISSKRTGGSWWLVGMADVEEERVERERLEREERRRAETLLARVEGKESAVSSVSMAMMCAGDPSLQVSCLQWELPLNVVPMYDDSEPMPATKSGVLDVQYI